MEVKIQNTKNIVSEELNDTPRLKGKFIAATGRRKCAIAQVRLYKNGSGLIMVNGKKINQYFATEDLVSIILQPLKLTGQTKDLNFTINVTGGGNKGQAEAIRHGISRTLEALDSAYRPSLKSKDLMTRDARIKERKKPGLKKARKAPQWSKR